MTASRALEDGPTPVPARQQAATDALWSVWYHTQNLGHLELGARMPAAIRPKPLGEALQLIHERSGPRGVACQRRCGKRFRDAGLCDATRLGEAFGRDASREIAPLVEPLVRGFERFEGKFLSQWQRLLGLPTKRPRPAIPDTRPDLPRGLPLPDAAIARVARSLALDPPEGPAAAVTRVGREPPPDASPGWVGCSVLPMVAESWYRGLSHTTRGCAVVSILNRSLEQLFDSLDPRNWSRCSDFMLRSEPVHTKTESDEHWEGFLFEEAVGGICRFQQVLWIWYGWDEDEDGTRHLRCHYRLHDSVRSWILGEERVGGIEVNHGDMLAYPYAPEADGRARSIVFIDKTLRFTSLAPGRRRASGIDLGQLLNFLAPAMVTLWAEDHAQTNPCCAWDA